MNPVARMTQAVMAITVERMMIMAVFMGIMTAFMALTPMRMGILKSLLMRIKAQYRRMKPMLSGTFWGKSSRLREVSCIFRSVSGQWAYLPRSPAEARLQVSRGACRLASWQ